MQRIVEREQTHAEVMGHEGRQHDPAASPFGHAGRRVVDRFIEAVAAGEPLARQRLKVAQHGRRRERRREDARVRRDDEILAETSLEAEPGDTERAVLVVLLQVLRVVGGLRNPPRHPVLRGVVDLALQHGAVGFVEQRVRGTHA